MKQSAIFSTIMTGENTIFHTAHVKRLFKFHRRSTEMRFVTNKTYFVAATDGTVCIMTYRLFTYAKLWLSNMWQSNKQAVQCFRKPSAIYMKCFWVLETFTTGLYARSKDGKICKVSERFCVYICLLSTIIKWKKKICTCWF